MKTNNKQIALLDICMSDYFTGYHLPCVSVSVYGKITCSEMADMIKDEINYSFDVLNLSEEDEQLYNNYCAELMAKCEEIFYQNEEEEDTDEVFADETAYAYFSVINPIIVNGITFLNS
jgi:hypothetical protein